VWFQKAHFLDLRSVALNCARVAPNCARCCTCFFVVKIHKTPSNSNWHRGFSIKGGSDYHPSYRTIEKWKVSSSMQFQTPVPQTATGSSHWSKIGPPAPGTTLNFINVFVVPVFQWNFWVEMVFESYSSLHDTMHIRALHLDIHGRRSPLQASILWGSFRANRKRLKNVIPVSS